MKAHRNLCSRCSFGTVKFRRLWRSVVDYGDGSVVAGVLVVVGIVVVVVVVMVAVAKNPKGKTFSYLLLLELFMSVYACIRV